MSGRKKICINVSVNASKTSKQMSSSNKTSCGSGGLPHTISERGDSGKLYIETINRLHQEDEFEEVKEKKISSQVSTVDFLTPMKQQILG